MPSVHLNRRANYSPPYKGGDGGVGLIVRTINTVHSILNIIFISDFE